MIDLPVDVVRSERRKKTVQAYLRDGRIRVMVPAGLDVAEERRLVEELAGKIGRRATSDGIDLTRRAELLASRYGLPIPADIAWSDRQMKRWGSCTPGESRIRISSRLVSMPSWVLDSVIVHELAHLEVAGHGPDFAELVARYELTERAKGYLIAVSEGVADAQAGAG